MKLFLLLVLLLLLFQSVYTQNEEEIWSLEENYISYFGSANHEAILSLYHSEFLGWPDSEMHPAGKKRAAKFLDENYPTPGKTTFKLEQEGIRILDNMAITHYLIFSTWVDENGEEQMGKTRITHTWIKEDSEWKIIGGMSNRK